MDTDIESYIRLRNLFYWTFFATTKEMEEYNARTKEPVVNHYWDCPDVNGGVAGPDYSGPLDVDRVKIV